MGCALWEVLRPARMGPGGSVSFVTLSLLSPALPLEGSPSLRSPCAHRCPPYLSPCGASPDLQTLGLFQRALVVLFLFQTYKKNPKTKQKNPKQNRKAIFWLKAAVLSPAAVWRRPQPSCQCSPTTC